MAATDSKVVSLPRRNLFNEIAEQKRGYETGLELFDVPSLVIDSNASRSDLRLIEESDDEVQQCIETRLDTLLGVDYRLEGGSEDVRNWLTVQLKRHYDTIVINAFNSKLYGYSVMERIWKLEDGYYIVDRVSEKPFEWFVPKRDETLFYKPIFYIITDKGDNIDGLKVDTEFKFLLTRHKPTWKNPRGKALLAYLFWPWFYRKATWQFWLQFLERNGQPLLVGTGNDPVLIAQRLALAVQDAVIGVPTGSDVKAVSPNNRGEAFGLAEDRLVRRIQKILLGQTLTSDVAIKGSGAKALGDVHNEVRLDKTIGDLKLVGPTVQNHVTALQRLNFPSSKPVNLIYAIDRGLELGRAHRDVEFWNTGVIEPTEQYIIREFGLKEGDFKIIPLEKRKGKNSQPGQDKQGSDKSKDENTGSSNSKEGADNDD